jgi:hypothetical protein
VFSGSGSKCGGNSARRTASPCADATHEARRSASCRSRLPRWWCSGVAVWSVRSSLSRRWGWHRVREPRRQRHKCSYRRSRRVVDRCRCDRNCCPPPEIAGARTSRDVLGITRGSIRHMPTLPHRVQSNGVGQDSASRALCSLLSDVPPSVQGGRWCQLAQCERTTRAESRLGGPQFDECELCGVHCIRVRRLSAPPRT